MIQMDTTTRTKASVQASGWLRAAAIAAALAVGAAEAQAQYRTGNDGRARDASNRVGSGGVNSDAVDNRVGPTGNQIVTGNVTGGREFRGPVGYRDPREFRGTTGFERSDRFVRDSSGARRTGPSLVQQPTAFYGNNLAEPLPGNYAPTVGATGGYVAVAPGPVGGEAVGFGGVRPGRTGIYGSELETSAAFGGTLETSPLYGVRPAMPFQSPNDIMRNDPLFNTSGDRLRTNDDAVRQMREELNQAAIGSRADQGGTGDDAGATGAVGAGGDAAGGPDAARGGLGEPLGSVLQSPVARPGSGLQNDSFNSSLNGDSIGGNLATGQGSQRRLLVPPAEQSQQYKELVRRMQNRTGDTTGQEASDFNRLRRAQAQGKPGNEANPNDPAGRQPADAAQPRPPAAPGRSLPPLPPASGGDATPPQDQGADAGPAVPTEPLEVKSLADGVKAKGMADMLRSAEQLMKDKKYESAVGVYDQAARVAPNNPMITLGRANALLGGGNYGQAEASLRRAIGASPALLFGRYDLNGFLGEERVKFLANDLRQVAATSPKEVRPRLLLAYLSYNTGNAPDASKYLAEAAQLAPNDGVVQQMQQTWDVLSGATTPPPPELNK